MMLIVIALVAALAASAVIAAHVEPRLSAFAALVVVACIVVMLWPW
jgi:hypothetical protein